MARVRGTLRFSSQSTTGDNRHATTAAIASGHSTGLNTPSSRDNPQTAATTSRMTVATARPVSANQRMRACFSVGGYILFERLNWQDRFILPRPVPILAQFGQMNQPPFVDQFVSRLGQAALINPTGLDFD